MSECESLTSFDFDQRTRVIYGAGNSARLGELCVEYGARHVLLVTDAGLVSSGHAGHCQKQLAAAGLAVTVFSDVTPNPTTHDVELGLKVARDQQVDFLVAVGGGSSIDCAKGINFLFTNGGRMQDYWGVGKARHPMLPMIAVPTTSGTGSEAQSYALISDAETHVKMACGDKKASCRAAILDPDLTISMPAGVTAATGIDAISHALESFVTTRRNSVSQLFSRRAWTLLAGAFPEVLARPESVDARGAMLLGAHLAGAAIENSMLGAAHALANPLTATYGTTHGLAIGVVLPHVIRFNQGVCEADYARLAKDAGLAQVGVPAGEAIAQWVMEMVSRAGCPTNLQAAGLELGDLPELAIAATKQWTGTFNPRPVSTDEYKELYTCAWNA